MYDQFYGFTGRPFQLTPDPHFYFESATHRKALSYLGYGLAQGEGFIVITGDIGSGKTTLVGHVMGNVDATRLTAAKIVSTQVEGDDMLRLAARAFGIPADGVTKGDLLGRFEAFLHAQARQGKRTLLIVDEGQNLGVSAIEELRMLSNFQLGGQSLLQIFLLGQPEFRDLLQSEKLEQLRQRVIATHHLDPMAASEIAPYIEHRLKLVGWTGNPGFTASAITAIHAATDGVPRRVNALMSRVLLMGAIDQLKVIDGGVVAAVVADMGEEGAHAPVAMPEVVAAEPELPLAAAAPSFVVPSADDSALSDIKAELDALREQVDATPAMDSDAPDRLAALEGRIMALEAMAAEQDDALRRVLTLLVEWVERGAQDTAQSRAA